MKLFKNKQTQIIAIIVVVFLLLLMFLSCFDPAEEIETETIVPGQTTSTVSDGKSKMDGIPYEGMDPVSTCQNAHWDECCSGFITATITHTWDYHVTEDASGACDDPITWEVYDSNGVLRYTAEQNSPTTTTQTFRGHWDCLNPWQVCVSNSCEYAISFEWSMTMICD